MTLPVGRRLFLNAQAGFPAGEEFVLQQHFRPYARVLEEQGFSVVADLPDDPGSFSAAFVLLPKNAVEARYDVARALLFLKPGGVLACAGANDAGGKRADAMLQEFGLKDVRHDSGNKARVAWGIKDGVGGEALRALDEGSSRFVPETGFVSQPGIFSWDRIDTGSQILGRHLPTDLMGLGADFGCGYGYLSRQVLETCKNISSLSCLDADARAVLFCKKNLYDIRGDISVRFMWEDLTQSVSGLRYLDWIVMNPPFHEGKKTDSDIGLQFIRTAHESLKVGGHLWMVANVGLPYEKFLGEIFSESEKIYEGDGYKVLRGWK
ncbi:MAG: class I SAM-dependent methyltransferase [Alphaproteobacteria bacterium]